jgi:hypothetical protein
MVPSGLMGPYWKIIKDESLVTVVLRDRAKNILKRINFFDEYSRPIEKILTDEEKKYYLREISLDMEYFGRSYGKAKVKYQMNGKSVSQVVDDLKKVLIPDWDS